MTYYPTAQINKALGIDEGANLADALAAIAQLRASVADTDTEALRTERNDYMRALDKARDERDEARKTATANREAADRLRAELKAATEERDDARTERARLDHNYRLLQQHVSSLEANLEKTERARDAAFCAIHHATAGYAV